MDLAHAVRDRKLDEFDFCKLFVFRLLQCFNNTKFYGGLP